MSGYHAHIERDATDCDGRMTQSYVLEMNDDELADLEWGDMTFEYRVLSTVVNVSPVHGGYLEVEPIEDGLSRLSWYETTDEGSRSIEATFCNNEDCDPRSHRQRDYAAEAMGY